MKNLKYLIGILSIYLIFSCKPLQNVTTIKEVIKTDTLIDIRTVEKFKYVQDTLVIDNPCDSAGILTTFYSKLSAPQGTIIIRSNKGNIEATVTLDSMKQVYETRYRSLVGKNVEKGQIFVRKNVIPEWAVWFMVISGVLSFLYIREKVSIFVK